MEDITFKKLSDETKEKIRLSHLGKSLSEYHKKQISKGLHLNSKITPSLCKQIVLARRNGMKYPELTKTFNLSHTTTWLIITGEHWIFRDGLLKMEDL